MLGSLPHQTECLARLSDIEACQLCLLKLWFDTTHVSTLVLSPVRELTSNLLCLLQVLLCFTVKLSVLEETSL